MLEKLENRRLLAATVVNPGASGVLVVDGSTGNNIIDLSVSANHLVIVIDGVAQSFELNPGFGDGEFHQLIINGDAGNDNVHLSTDVFSAPESDGVTINGDAGNDTIQSGPGNDLINGGDGDDSISGGDGNDTLDGGLGADTIIGEDGDDTVTYASRNTPITVVMNGVADDGAAGELDLIDESIDIIMGGSGNDSLTSESTGNKTLEGGDGNDTLIGGVASDSLAGGNGDDVMDGMGNDDIFDGGAGNDTVTYASRSGGIIVTLDGTANDGEGGENDNVLANVETVIGTDNDDSISAAGALAGHNFIGGLGTDTLIGGTANDTLIGGDGNDSLTGGTGNDSMSGGVGNDSAFGGAGNDNISGDTGDDYLSGEDGNDTVSGGDGNDRILGGNNDDSLTGNDGNDQIAPGRGKDTLLGGLGEDRADYSYEKKAVLVSLDGVANDGIKGETDNVATDIEDIRGGLANDVLKGSSARNSLIGGAGNDSLYGLNGNDILSGEAGNDLLDGGNGTDRLRGGLGTDTIIGGVGTDTADYLGQDFNLNISLDGIANDGAAGEKDWIKSDVENVQTAGGNDIITGNSGANLIYSGSGNDTVTGGLGADTIFGEAGNDTIHTKDGVIDRIGDHIGTDVLDKDAGDVVV